MLSSQFIGKDGDEIIAEKYPLRDLLVHSLRAYGIGSGVYRGDGGRACPSWKVGVAKVAETHELPVGLARAGGMQAVQAKAHFGMDYETWGDESKWTGQKKLSGSFF